MSEIIKDLKYEFGLISELENLKEIPCSLHNNASKDLLISKCGKRYTVDINCNYKEISSSNIRLMNINDELIKINDSLTIKIISSIFKSLTSGQDKYKLEIAEWASEGFSHNNKEEFYRLIIPKVSKDRICFEKCFATHFNALKDDVNTISVNRCTWNGITVDCDNKGFIIYQLSDFFILECLTQIKYSNFDRLSRIILASFGFITGYVPMNYGYTFSYEDITHKFKEVKFISTYIGTYKTQYSIINLNPYSYYQNCDLKMSHEESGLKRDERIEEIEKDLKPVTKEMFSRLCNEMAIKNDFSDVIFAILEVNCNSNISQRRGALYAVILEMITNVISNDNKEKLSYIKDEKIAKSLQDTLQEQAKIFCENNSLDNFDNSPIKAKIQNINAPTNRDKLFKPFEILGINLTKEEKAIIDKRNIFLHGNSIWTEGENIKSAHNLLYICYELNYLINALVLKYIGYSGKVKNLSKICLDYTEMECLRNVNYYKEI